MDKINHNLERSIVIVGAGAAGLLLKSLLNKYYPNFKIYILERKNIDKKNLSSFFLKNPKYLHPNVFSNFFKILLKKYLFETYLDIYKLNFFNSFFFNTKKLSRIDFFKKLIFSDNDKNIEIISKINEIELINDNNLIKEVIFKKNEKIRKIRCDFIFDCSGTNNFFYNKNKKNNNILKINKLKNKILITFHLKFFNKDDEKKIIKIINNEDVTLNYPFHDLTIMKNNEFYTFTFVSKLENLDKLKAKTELKNFLKDIQINDFVINKSLKWIHKNNVFYDLKDHSYIKNLIPVGDSLLLVDPSNGMGLTTILLKTIYITRKIKNFDIRNYFNFSNELFLLLSDQKLGFSKKKGFLRNILSSKKNFIPFYNKLRSVIVNYKDRKFFKNILKKI